MIRNSILYRRWWYIRKRNIKKIHLLLRFVLAAIIMWLIVLFTQGSLFAYLGF